jgi:hypothetical protein
VKRELKKSVKMYPIPKITLRQFTQNMIFFAELVGEKQPGQKAIFPPPLQAESVQYPLLMESK